VPKTVRYWGEFIYNVEPAESITEIYDIIDPATDKLPPILTLPLELMTVLPGNVVVPE
jgi:hypothetical protein